MWSQTRDVSREFFFLPFFPVSSLPLFSFFLSYLFVFLFSFFSFLFFFFLFLFLFFIFFSIFSFLSLFFSLFSLLFLPPFFFPFHSIISLAFFFLFPFFFFLFFFFLFMADPDTLENKVRSLKSHRKAVRDEGGTLTDSYADNPLSVDELGRMLNLPPSRPDQRSYGTYLADFPRLPNENRFCFCFSFPFSSVFFFFFFFPVTFLHSFFFLFLSCFFFSYPALFPFLSYLSHQFLCFFFRRSSKYAPTENVANLLSFVKVHLPFSFHSLFIVFQYPLFLTLFFRECWILNVPPWNPSKERKMREINEK